MLMKPAFFSSLALGIFLALLLPAPRGFAQYSQSPRVSPYSAPGSIFPIEATSDGRMNSFFSDPIAAGVGDFITIVVNMSTTATRAKNLTTSKVSNVNDSLTSLVIPNNVAGNYAMQWGANQNFAGGGSQANTEAMTTTIEAQIKEVMPDGNFRVEAHRSLQEGKEKTAMTLTGIVRRIDLSSTNSVSSTQVADLEIKEDSAGDLTRAERKGWLTSVYEFVNPF